MPADLKKEVAEYIPEEIYDKMATEQDAIDPKDLKEFLKKEEPSYRGEVLEERRALPLKVPASPGGAWPE